MSAIDFDTGNRLARIGSLHVLDAARRVVCVSWADGGRRGRKDRVDLSPLIDRLRFFAPLREDAALFATARLVDDGFAVAWGDGGIDMSAMSVERLVADAGLSGFVHRLQTRIVMLGRDVMDWRKRA